MPEHETLETPTDQQAFTADGGNGSAIPQFAVTMANQQIAKVGNIVVGAADTLDHYLGEANLPLGPEIHSLVTDVTGRIRKIGQSINEQDAGVVAADMQKGAAARPALTIAIGAAIGAALAIALVGTAPKQPVATAA
ncbi:hypothetical protein [Sphingomonas immobilis]|jgi:hypothetical protein|uniref:Uncharacterized protein n=1 Tax=Sphingomonas immobilis TaxID=3063997 RepID=A0ABT8ZW56_9SPHN|nr:hypothetical protein [Sphingomonas sp. CA1-15]MDO7841810.1 hypothetical protein [Sphingomonas sp. CA1-15]